MLSLSRFWPAAGVLLLVVPAIGAEERDDPADVDGSSTVVSEFAESMTDVRLSGRFTTRLPDGSERASQPDAYRIASITPLGTDGRRYTVNAAIAYRRADGESIDLTVPVVVQIDAAGPVPVLSVRNLSIPLLGNDFGACILFDGDQYAGTWSHGTVGGAMYGRVLREDPSQLPGVADRETPEEPQP